MTLQLSIFVSVIALTLSGIAIYVHRRASWAFRLGKHGRRALLVVLLAAVVLPFGLRFAGVVARDALGGMFATFGFGVGLTLLIATGFLVPFDLTRWIARRVTGAPKIDDAPTAAVTPDAASPSQTTDDPPALAPPPAPTLTRRDLLSRSYVGLAIGTGAATSLYGLTLGRHDYVLEQVPIPLRKLPRALDGYTIAQLSDLHVGLFVDERELDVAIDLVRRARPDVIVLTGDLVDHDVRRVPALGRFARRLVELGARDGVVAIPGNHDYYTGIDAVLATLRAAGVQVMRNDARVIGDRGGSFALLGVDDVWAPRNGFGPGADLPATIAQVPPDLARVLLCHNPELFPEAAEHVDLQLSGHTHGGQVNILVRPADLALRHGYIDGHYVRGESQIYVNRGFGTVGPPARIGAPPEVSRIVLTTS